jgi:LysM repeat protein
MPRQRTHVVASGETLAAIARHAGVSIPALEAANPGVNPKHLHTGQTIYLPLP